MSLELFIKACTTFAFEVFKGLGIIGFKIKRQIKERAKLEVVQDIKEKVLVFVDIIEFELLLDLRESLEYLLSSSSFVLR